MASQYLINSDFKRRLIFRKHEKHSLFLTCMLAEVSVYKQGKHFSWYEYPFFLYISFLRQKYCLYGSTIRNRCTGNASSRAVFSSYKLSRLSFKKYALVGALNGITKSSW